MPKHNILVHDPRQLHPSIAYGVTPYVVLGFDEHRAQFRLGATRNDLRLV